MGSSTPLESAALDPLADMLRTLLALTLGLFIALGSASCAKKKEAKDDPGAELAFSDAPGPGDGNGFEAAATAEEQSEILNEIWGVLTTPNCWDSSYNGSHVGNVSQYQFYGNYEYRHFGFSINFGGITLYDVGTYQGYPTAVVSTWSGEIEMIVLTSEEEFVHVFWHLDGAPVPVTYRGVAGACL